MPDENVTAIPPAADPSAPAATPPAAEPVKARSIQEEKFLANLRSTSSTPNTETTPPQDAAPSTDEATPPAGTAEPTPEPAPTDGTEPPPAPAEGEGAAELGTELEGDDLSSDLPGTTQPVIEPGAIHPDSPLPADAPAWQQQAFIDIQNDPALSDDEKKTITQLNPSAWSRARRWQKDTKLLGQFRNEDIPIAQVYEMLSRQSKERTVALETEALNRVLSNAERMTDFSKAHPQVFASLLSGLITQHTEFVGKALKAHGLEVIKPEPVNADKLLEELHQNELWETIEGTPLAAQMEQRIKDLASKIGTADVSPEDLAKELGGDSPPQSVSTEAYQKTQEAIMTARDRHWLVSISDGLKAAGIKPATPEETRRNPVAAKMKDIVHAIALRGLDGVVENWDTAAAKWGERNEGFQASFTELQALLNEGDIDRFGEYASGLNPLYYEFGTRRAGIPLIKKLYAEAERLLNGAAAAPPPAPAADTPTPGTTDTAGTQAAAAAATTPGTENGRYLSLAERRFRDATGARGKHG